MVAFVVGQTQRVRQSSEQLGRRVSRAALFEAHDVVNADSGQGCELFASEAGSAPTRVGWEADIGRSHSLPPCSEDTGEFSHVFIVLSADTIMVVLAVPPLTGACMRQNGGRTMDA